MWGQACVAEIYFKQFRIIPTRVGTRKQSPTKAKERWDHPHACGDKKDDQYLIVSAKGSSPRVWGQVQFMGQDIVRLGIIPTRVGTRLCYACCSKQTWDHPHACGDKLLSMSLSRSAEGSSPRVWGQEARLAEEVKNERIIPTRVGTRCRNVRNRQIFRDHPHACGDKE